METMNLALPTTGATTANRHQQDLNTVVMNKVHAMVDRNAAGVQATMERLIAEGKIAQDYIAPLGVNLKAANRQPVVTFGNDDNRVYMNLPDGQFRVNRHAVGQVADRLGVPSRYLTGLATGKSWEVALAAYLLNEHSQWTERNRVLVRTVGNEVRGVLSDSYRRLNAVELITAFVETAAKQGALISDAFMTDTKVYAETILPTPFTIPTQKNGDVIVFVGARFSTSDYGDGAVDMRTFMLNGACTNGMVRESAMKQVHLGAKLPDNLALSERTYELDTKTTVSALRDLTKGLYSKENIMRKAVEIQLAAAEDVNFDVELKHMLSVGSLLKSEVGEVKKVLMRNDPNDGVQGGSTLWKLTQAITAHAREVAPERARELHEISGALLNRLKVNV